MRLVGIGSAIALVAGLLVAVGSTPAAAVSTDVWTESSYASVFRDSGPSADAGRVVRLDAARNEYEAAQIVVRRNEAFTVNAVTPSALTGPGGTIAADNVTYNFVDYQYLNSNTHNGDTGKMDIYPGVRTGAGLYPDRLTNERSKQVAARSTQSIWVRVFVPPTAAGGVYTGTVNVVTDKGTTAVPVRVDVRAVTLPESDQGAFTTSLWHLFTGNISWDEGGGETIDFGYGYSRYTPQWWELLQKVATMFKQYRTNNLMLPITKILADAGSLPDGHGGYTFDWTKFDQIVELFQAAGAVKRIEGFPEPAFTRGYDGSGNGIRDIEVIRNTNGRPTLTWVDWSSTEGQNWLQGYLPALRAHLEAKGWNDMFWTHAGDEPQPGNVTDYRQLAQRMQQIWPGIKLGDAVDQVSVQSQIMDLNHQAVAQEYVYDGLRDYFDDVMAGGKEVWLYNSTAPRGNYLNRFIDQPEWYQRMTIWYAYSRGLTGYLHWAMNNWQYPIDVQDAKGDGLIVRPDKERNTVEVTPRYESLRDGIEDYELLNLVGQRDKGLARGLAAGLVQRTDKFTPDTAYMQRIRAIALDAAAGKPMPADPAHGATTTSSAGNGALAVDGNAATSWQPGTGSQWLQVDLGRQVQLDGVNLRWTTPGVGFKLQTSYDGTRWTEVAANPASDGGTDFIGLNGKGRYLRLETTAGTPSLAELEVAGAPLAKTNLAGGRSYTRSSAPNDQPDSGFESTDGVLADAWDDGRTYAYKAPTGTVDVTIDLGSAQNVDSAAIHAYEEYPGYRPDKVRIATSVDGSTYTSRGQQFTPQGPSGVWYSFQFPRANARYIRITFDKSYTADASSLMIDEIEVYAADAPSLTAGLPYRKSRSVPTDPSYPDVDGKESTDGVVATGFAAGYGYHLTTAGETLTVDVTLDLGTPQPISKIRTSRYDDGTHDYAPSVIRVSTGDSPVALTSRGTTTQNGRWYELPVTTTARYVELRFEKTRTQDFADYLFLDEIEVLNQAGTNLALNKPYRTSRPADPDPSYPDTGGKESTDSVIAGAFNDGLSYGYRLPNAGDTQTVDLTFDLGTARAVSTVRLHAYDDHVHNYAPDNVQLLAGDNPLALQPIVETSSPRDQWFELPAAATARYLTVRVTKTRTQDFADYLFLDEVTAT
ncbi:glycoside hydrolase domain-containing protein [Kribbella sp. NPDC058245]|uniref:glycoside hydrolase domain-containing protein n=1 Tax=Kribbella sp. NPDC058245 TaxID=3346399 RepID=UPI0036EB2D42